MRRAFFAQIVRSLLILLIPAAVQAQSFSWAQGISGYSAISYSTFDYNNNVLSLGGFSGTVDLDPGPGVINFTAVSTLTGDLFLRKQDPAGNLIWAKQFAGMSSGVHGLYGKAMALDDLGNIYIAGNIYDSVDVDPGPAVYVLSSNGGLSSFILKLDSSGNFVWSKLIGNTTNIVNNFVTFTSLKIVENLIYIGGSFGGTIDADPESAYYNITSVSTGNPAYVATDILIEKLDTSGNFIWVKTMGGMGADVCHSLSLDSLLNIYFTGIYQSSADFDPGPGIFTLSSNIVPPANNTNTYVAKLDSAGNFQWAKPFTSTDNEGLGISVSPVGGIYTTGHFEGIVDFDPGPGVYNLGAPTRSVFTLKLNNNGDFKWATMTGTAGLNEGRAIATDSLGNVYTASLLAGPADLDPGPGNYFITAGVGIQKLDSSGNFVWGAGVGGDIPGWIGLDNEQSVYCTGSFTGFNKDFDPGGDTYLLSGSGQGSGFILKLCQQTDTVSLIADTTTACDGDTILLHAPVIAGATYRWYRNYTLVPDTTHTIAATLFGDYRVRIGGGSCPSFGYKILNFYPTGNPTISLPTTPLVATTGQQVSLNATVVNGGPLT